MNLVKCNTCKKILTSEEIKNHDFCDIVIKNQKSLFVSCLATFTNKKGENCVMFTDLDGVSYEVIEKKPELVPYEPADQPTGNTSNSNLRGNSTHL